MPDIPGPPPPRLDLACVGSSGRPPHSEDHYRRRGSWRVRWMWGFVLPFASAFCAAEPPIPASERTRMLAGFTAEVIALSDAILRSPRQVPLYSRRGDCHLFLGNFAASSADFERMIALEPAQDTPHWRLGIAYYFAGEFAKSSRQFEKYHAHDGRDRENGIWKFLADAKARGLKIARRDMPVYSVFDREPFPTLYAMFAGELTSEAFFADLEQRGFADDPRVQFFANYYAGIYEDISGRHVPALRFLHAAVANKWGRTAENGPAYMWQVARLHYERHSQPSP